MDHRGLAHLEFAANQENYADICQDTRRPVARNRATCFLLTIVARERGRNHVAEVPDHLIQRSASRRAALSGQPAPAAAPASDAQATASATVAASAVTGGDLVTVASGGGAPPADIAAAAITMDAPDPIEVLREKRNHVPFWMWPVLLLVPFVAVLYLGAFASEAVEEEPEPLAAGETIYANNCASCHGANGQGGVGRVLWKGEVNKTFPDKYTNNAGAATNGVDAQKQWIRGGSTTGLPYGDPQREGGQHISRGGMPAFGGQLSEIQIENVVLYVRTTFAK